MSNSWVRRRSSIFKWSKPGSLPPLKSNYKLPYYEDCKDTGEEGVNSRPSGRGILEEIVDEPVHEPVDETVREPIPESVHEPAHEPVHEPTFESIPPRVQAPRWRPTNAKLREWASKAIPSSSLKRRWSTFLQQASPSLGNFPTSPLK